MLSSRPHLGFAFALLLIAATPAAARPPVRALHCGASVARDTTLAHNLTGCRGTGLTIVADGVTLDLGGHTVAGTNAPHGDGIAVDGHPGVTVRNGTVRGFRRNGVSFVNSPRGTARHLTIRRIGAGGKEGEDVSAGVFAMKSDRLRVLDDRISNDVHAFQADGVVILNSARSRVAGTDSSHNAYNGIVLAGSPHSTVTGNHTAHNQSSGILVADSPSIVVTRNRSEGQTHDDTGGILILHTAGGLVQHNTLVGNERGVSLENGTTNVRVLDNTVKGGDDGITILGADDNRIARDTVSGGRGVGVLFDGLGPGNSDDNGTPDDNTVENVSATGEHVAGFLLTGGAVRNVLRQNRAVRNDGNGFQLESAGNRLAADVANRNGGHGFSAVAGTVDGGGNTASGNHLSPQCVGVAC